MLPAMSTWDMSQPPKMSPAALVSAGMASTRIAGERSLGRASSPDAAPPMNQCPAYMASMASAKRSMICLRRSLSVGVMRPSSTVQGSKLRVTRWMFA